MVDFSEINFKFDASGLIPCIVQEINSNEVLMCAYMNEESLERTINEGVAWYYSRSRKSLWRKGETSGNIQIVKGMYCDCDADTLLLKVEQMGVACHTGNHTCFYRALMDESVFERNILFELHELIKDRKQNFIKGAYTSYLFESGIDKILKKIGEESSEIIIAAKNKDKRELVYEISDLVYHVLVMMVEKDITIEEIEGELVRRNKKKLAVT